MKKKSIFKTYRSCINTHLKLLNSGDLENLHYPLHRMTTHLWAWLQPGLLPTWLPAVCGCSQLWPSIFFFFWHFYEFWTCKMSLTGSIRNGTSVFILITSLARIAAPVLLWCWLYHRKEQVQFPPSMPMDKSPQVQREMRHVNNQKAEPTTTKAKYILRICH